MLLAPTPLTPESVIVLVPMVMRVSSAPPATKSATVMMIPVPMSAALRFESVDIEQVLTGTARSTRIGIKAVDSVVAEAGTEHEHVGACTTIHRIVACATGHGIGAAGTIEGVVTLIARDDVGKPVAGAVDVACARLERQVLDIGA